MTNLRLLSPAVFASAVVVALALAPTAAGAQTCQIDFSLTDCNTYQQVVADSTSHQTNLSCGNESYPGSEITYEVTPAAGEQVVAFIDSQEAGVDLDLVLHTGTCGESDACVAASSAGNTEELTWTADGSTYFVTVEERNGFGGHPFTFSLGCPTACDPATDVVQTISCSTNLSATTAGGTTALDYFSCGVPFSHLAQANPEAIYAFSPQQSGEVTFTLDNMTTDQDLYVLEAGCDPAACIASATDLSTNVDSVTFDAQAGTVYYIVVEAFGGPASYDLAFAVGPGGGCLEDCDNATDDDLDGDIDCDDSDCAEDLPCCDSDGDGACAGDCAPDNPDIGPNADETCGNGIDDDCDLDIDEGCNVTGPDAGTSGQPDAGSGQPDAGSPVDPGIDAGTGPGSGDEIPKPDGGCGCRAGNGPASGLIPLLLCALALGFRRRRRRG